MRVGDTASFLDVARDLHPQDRSLEQHIWDRHARW
jgi:hypothetical protein